VYPICCIVVTFYHCSFAITGKRTKASFVRDIVSKFDIEGHVIQILAKLNDCAEEGAVRWQTDWKTLEINELSDAQRERIRKRLLSHGFVVVPWIPYNKHLMLNNPGDDAIDAGWIVDWSHQPTADGGFELYE
jgi:hypothetical protein